MQALNRWDRSRDRHGLYPFCGVVMASRPEDVDRYLAAEGEYVYTVSNSQRAAQYARLVQLGFRWARGRS